MRLEPAVPAEALAAIRAPFLSAGATPVEVPVLQPLALLLELAGEAMRPRLFVVQAEGGEEAALRPDFTIAVARAHLDGGVSGGRYFYEGKAFRAAGATARAEEFLQVGLEAFGGDDPVAADAQAAGLAWRASLAGGRDDLTLRFGDIALFAAFIDSLDLAPLLAARLKRVFSRPRLLAAELDGSARAGEAQAAVNPLAGVSEDQAVAALAQLWAMAGVSPVGGRPPEEIVRRLAERAEAARAPHLTEDEADVIRRYLALSGPPQAVLDQVAALAGPARASLDAALKAWTARLEALAAQGVALERCTLTTAFGRAFGYYDGVLFEVRSAALAEDRPVAAGGRYDGLIARLGGGAGGAVGCMVRPARALAAGGE
ncbi:ATP phosphoribosyltransferase regulatory subunit [Caulobacter ginsengisoli]|uniref:Histidine--tRNA ligase n=1 Tax=Caulobacter ginsengisoli TaxID=400775 RepID=A0ABU0IWX7_9CAUL|nr:ATP phosphoribosyltransferase regulatory subunit [Caulobacter ginsengisoli]MDQ0466521.1 ATP phosphoribosyltransferase regulatory subunit [Caulobacter ginsengisoli]